jgi:protein involved in polysaccharide export with SLBB domain
MIKAALKRGRQKSRWLALLTVMLCGLLGSGPALATDDFVVGPGDKLAITVHRRTDLSGEFRVLPGGALSLPYVGNLPVAGKSVEQVRDAVMQRLRDDAALLDPRVSVEIAEMQPVLVTGRVRRPGQYPFQLGMTAGHALAAAGGPRRLEADEVGANIEIVRLRERLRQAQDSYGVALLRHARWAAEARDADDLEVPQEAARYLSSERLQQTLTSEQQLLRGRKAGFHSLLAMLTAQTAALNTEVQERQENAVAKEKERALLQQETEYIDSLMKRGLTPRTSRVIELARLATQVEGERRQILSNIARARQEIIRLEHERNNAETQRQLEARTGLKEAEDNMAGLRVTLEEARTGLAQLSEALPADEAPLGARPAAKVEILRIRATPPQRLEADADTPLLPGDLVEFSPGQSGGRVAIGPQR